MKLKPTSIGSLTGLGLITLAAGIIIIGRGTWLAWDGTSSALLGPGATVIASATAGIISAQSIKTWKHQRQLDRDKANFQVRQQVYTALAEDFINMFPSGSADPGMRQVRATAAVWASDSTIEELANWLKVKNQALSQSQRVTDKQYIMPQETQLKVKEQMEIVLRSMRTDLFGAEYISPGTITKSIFDDSHAEPHQS